jgi:hypothetical protein
VRTLHLPGTPPVILRRRGDRELEDIPPTEVAAVVHHLSHDPSISDDEIKRLLLSACERVRLTSSASDFFDDCITLAQRSPR